MKKRSLPISSRINVRSSLALDVNCECFGIVYQCRVNILESRSCDCATNPIKRILHELRTMLRNVISIDR